MRIKYIIFLILLSSCGAFSDAGKALRNEKITSTDEFLIEKRGPLSTPPDMNELPIPKKPKAGNSINKVEKSEEKELKENSRIENILLEEIRKN